MEDPVFTEKCRGRIRIQDRGSTDNCYSGLERLGGEGGSGYLVPDRGMVAITAGVWGTHVRDGALDKKKATRYSTRTGAVLLPSFCGVVKGSMRVTELVYRGSWLMGDLG